MTRTQQIVYIKDHYLTKPYKQIAREIGRSEYFVYYHMKKNKWIVPDHIKQRFKEQSRFKPGIVSRNKGKKWSDFMSEEAIARVKKNLYKKGNRPHNTLYDGAISIRYDCGRPYQWIRLSKNKWQPLHIHTYEQQVGPIPQGMVVSFIDGDTMNTEISNLQLLTRSELARICKNGGHKLPPPMKESIKLITRIKSTIDEKQNNRPQ